MLFYSALHSVDALLHTLNKNHNTSHIRRNQRLQRLTERGLLSQQALEDYYELYARSRALRYESEEAVASDFLRLLTIHFRRLEAEIIPRLPGSEAQARLEAET